MFQYLPINSRIDRGEAMLLAVHIMKARNNLKNKYHFSKNPLAFLHSTHVVVQGSPILVGLFPSKSKEKYSINVVNFQDLFHSTAHWLTASGIPTVWVDNHMEADPYIPLPKQNENKPLVFEQLIMLWLISVLSLTAGFLIFFCELIAGAFAKRTRKHAGTTQVNILKPFNGRGAWAENQGVVPQSQS